jgi:hypothetical protein
VDTIKFYDGYLHHHKSGDFERKKTGPHIETLFKLLTFFSDAFLLSWLALLS